MRLRTLSLSIISLIVFSGCAFAVATVQPVSTPTAEIIPRLDPSPTPSDNPYPLTCQVTDLSVHIDQGSGYCFAYPSRFMLADEGGVRGPNLDDSLTPLYVTFGVEVKPADKELTARGEAEKYLKEFTDIDVDTFAWNPVMVGGEWGWMVEPVPTIGAWRFVFIQHNGNLYRLSYWPVDIPKARADVDELAQVTMASFAFTR